MPMDWPTLLCNSRMHDPEPTATRGRSPFQQDLDRIIFSAAFRRFAHKTQVHPLSPNDHVHTRLTHSIEVASVGRSLGTMVGNEIASKLKSKILPDYFGYAVQAACLAHDIGSPPFGHSGESAIQSWFKTAQRKAGIFTKVNADTRREDFERFEGNAQGFRILTQLENAKWDGGLRLTYAVLGAFAKYPIASHISDEDPDHYPGAKKFGFFQYFTEVADVLGLIRRHDSAPYWCRHPLAFLVEAADDICYAIIDIEDGFELGYLTFREASEVLSCMAPETQYTSGMTESDKIGKLRAKAIGNLIEECVKVFVDNEQGLLNGSFACGLIELTKFKAAVQRAKSVGRRKVYNSENTIKLEIAGTTSSRLYWISLPMLSPSW
jgi:dGTPase